MAEPPLDLRDVSVVVQSIRGGRRAQRMHAKAVDLRSYARHTAISSGDVVIDRP